ncbi:PqqD family peptide modification chaperone [Microbacterium sp. Kw_RZR3]|uniref:PqqD family peptide modification chaperone n=1 Tax=unclassified Microbacterium TaxID=2609290 RepID=UPI0023DCD581|nr:PqqD family peptide modification chaperone [Microbacterium sp. Kw_RZR3]MDF2045183.1 PqqD family peptide modification chaperone [Microbacterium sp. Kw_RZR3]MDF2918998.1 ABC-type sugar transport system, ATPase component [Microbacterium sp.]
MPSPLTTFDVDALGVTVRIDVSSFSPTDRDLLAGGWSGARSSRGAAPASVVRCRADLPLDAAAADLTTRVTLAALSARRGELWMVHAGAVADERGRVVLFSGRSGMGKTTLMSRLAREFAYVTDESVGVTADGTVLPYRKPLSVIVGAGAKHQLPPGSLGLRDLPSTPLRLHAIVVLDRDEDAPVAGLEPLDMTDAIAAIAPQCSYLSELDAPLATLLGHIESVGGPLRLRYREAEDALPLIRDLLASPPRDAISTLERTAIVPASAAQGYARTPALDAITLADGRLAVLRRSGEGGSSVHVLDGIGPTLWRLASGVTLDDLVAAAVRAHGNPADGDARSAVRTTLDELRAEGLIEYRT